MADGPVILRLQFVDLPGHVGRIDEREFSA
jgi:hypothetical protein